MTVLILGGTSEAAALDRHLADQAPEIRAIVSLAGHTADPRPLNLPVRIGGFGGIEGLRRYLQEEGIVAVVDATHPFAAIMPFHAQAACKAENVPLLAIRRKPWEPREGDRWNSVIDMDAAVEALGTTPRRVFLTVGRLELPHFADSPRHRYLVRVIEPIGDRLPLHDVTVIQQRGPFHADDEEDLMRREGVEILVTKNSGGDATAGKLIAARRLGLPVIMVERPAKPDVESVEHIDQVLPWLVAQGLFVTERGV
ncbi:cobalt-precorrin-6A reductase [Bosea sp. PAMC 26642]|uniref:cobalt-precorrin-6A reductase n=1 Tax=Bosea sp. (strain PAMC 26642) TaxID=1792307 RepID=UPI00076FE21D|nr:cobalt-precorrin-6A reductase [Bosea sp. PAMC 26642]AMJ62623.1 cobalt-precorrin-6A reductase [Bosea sp. PAMC 26642]